MIHKKYIFLILFVLSFSFALLVGGLAPYYLFYILMLSTTIPLIHNLLILNKIKGVIKVPSGALYMGDKIDVEYILENKSKLTIPYMEIKNHITRQLTGKDTPDEIISLDGKSFFF